METLRTAEVINLREPPNPTTRRTTTRIQEVEGSQGESGSLSRARLLSLTLDIVQRYGPLDKDQVWERGRHSGLQSCRHALSLLGSLREEGLVEPRPSGNGKSWQFHAVSCTPTPSTSKSRFAGRDEAVVMAAEARTGSDNPPDRLPEERPRNPTPNTAMSLKTKVRVELEPDPSSLRQQEETNGKRSGLCHPGEGGSAGSSVERDYKRNRIFSPNVTTVQVILQRGHPSTSASRVERLLQGEVRIDPALERLATGEEDRNVLRARQCPGIEMVMWGPPGHFVIWGRRAEQVAAAQRLLRMEQITLDLPWRQGPTVQQFCTEVQTKIIKETGEVRVCLRGNKVDLAGTHPSVWRTRRWFEQAWAKVPPENIPRDGGVPLYDSLSTMVTALKREAERQPTFWMAVLCGEQHNHITIQVCPYGCACRERAECAHTKITIIRIGPRLGVSLDNGGAWRRMADISGLMNRLLREMTPERVVRVRIEPRTITSADPRDGYVAVISNRDHRGRRRRGPRALAFNGPIRLTALEVFGVRQLELWRPSTTSTDLAGPETRPKVKEPAVYGSMRLLEKGLRDSLPTLLRQAGWRRDTMSPMHREECALAGSAVCRQLCGHPIVRHLPGSQEEGVMLRVDWNGRSLVQVSRDLVCSINLGGIPRSQGLLQLLNAVLRGMLPLGQEPRVVVGRNDYCLSYDDGPWVVWLVARKTVRILQGFTWLEMSDVVGAQQVKQLVPEIPRGTRVDTPACGGHCCSKDQGMCDGPEEVCELASCSHFVCRKHALRGWVKPVLGERQEGTQTPWRCRHHYPEERVDRKKEVRPKTVPESRHTPLLEGFRNLGLSAERWKGEVNQMMHNFGPTRGGLAVDVRPDGLCFDRALLVVSLLTDEKRARRYLFGALPKVLGRREGEGEEWEVLRQLPLPCLLKAVIGTSDKPCCRRHQGKFAPRRGEVRGHFEPWYDLKDWRQGGVAACIRHARARLMEEPWILPGDYDTSVQACLVKALNVKVWMSCMWEMAEWQGPGEGPRRMSARPLAVTGTAGGQPDGENPPELTHLVAILRPNVGPGHCWVTLTPAQTACLGLVCKAHRCSLAAEIPHFGPNWHPGHRSWVDAAQTKGLCPLWVHTPEGSFAWKQLYDVTTSGLHGALLDALHPAHRSTGWTLKRSTSPASTVKQLIYEHEAGTPETGGATLQGLGPRDPTGREILRGHTVYLGVKTCPISPVNLSARAIEQWTVRPGPLGGYGKGSTAWPDEGQGEGMGEPEVADDDLKFFSSRTIEVVPHHDSTQPAYTVTLKDFRAAQEGRGPEYLVVYEGFYGTRDEREKWCGWDQVREEPGIPDTWSPQPNEAVEVLCVAAVGEPKSWSAATVIGLQDNFCEVKYDAQGVPEEIVGVDCVRPATPAEGEPPFKVYELPIQPEGVVEWLRGSDGQRRLSKLTKKAGLLLLKISAGAAENPPKMGMVGSSHSIQEARMLGKQLLKYGLQLMQLDATLRTSETKEPEKERGLSGGRTSGIGDGGTPPPGALQEKFQIDPTLLGMAIGLKGANLKKARDVSEDVLNILYDDDGNFTVFAKSQGALNSAREILEMTTREIDLPSERIGYIIGTKGKQIQELQDETGVIRAKVSNGGPDGRPTMQLIGTKVSVCLAESLLEQMIELLNDIDEKQAEMDKRRMDQTKPTGSPSAKGHGRSVGRGTLSAPARPSGGRGRAGRGGKPLKADTPGGYASSAGRGRKGGPQGSQRPGGRGKPEGRPTCLGIEVHEEESEEEVATGSLNLLPTQDESDPDEDPRDIVDIPLEPGEIEPAPEWLEKVMKEPAEGTQLIDGEFTLNGRPVIAGLDTCNEHLMVNKKLLTKRQWKRRWRCRAKTVGIGGSVKHKWYAYVQLSAPDLSWTLLAKAIVVEDGNITRDVGLLICSSIINILFERIDFSDPELPRWLYRTAARATEAARLAANYEPDFLTRGQMARRLTVVTTPGGVP